MPRVNAHLDGTKKFQELILYISRVSEGDPAYGASKLNKLLFFGDFRHYLSTGQSITNQEHQKLENGPAPRQLVPVMDLLRSRQDLAISETEYFGHVQKRPVALRDPDLTLFSGQEIATIDHAIKTFWRMNATEISHLSHEFAGWQGVEIGQTIPYESVLIDPRDVTEAERVWALDTTGMEQLLAGPTCLGSGASY
jgi:Protein of unknown function (DUF4065)